MSEENIQTAGGTKLWIAGVHAPATDTVVEYAALTWVEIKGVMDADEIGEEAQIQKITLLNNTVIKRKGASDPGDITLRCGKDGLDTGQNALKAAQKTKHNYDFKMEIADKGDPNDTNTIYYFNAQVGTQKDNIGDANNPVTARFVLAINAMIEVPTTVVA